MTGWIIDQLSDWTDVDPETRCDEADWKWAATEQLVRPRPRNSLRQLYADLRVRSKLIP
jgi:hypothetical protein